MFPWDPRANTGCRSGPNSIICSTGTPTTSMVVEAIDQPYRLLVRQITSARSSASTTVHGMASSPSDLTSRNFQGKGSRNRTTLAGSVVWLKRAKSIIDANKQDTSRNPSRNRGPLSHIGAWGCQPRMVTRIALGLSIFACSVGCWADPVLPTLIGDHMVLQQGREIHIWGKADAGETVTVSLAGHAATTRADADQQWSVRLPALPAGGPFTLTVLGNQKIQIRDVMIGEVWIASGQSNMTFALDGAE